jgi:hypothetical protein
MKVWKVIKKVFIGIFGIFILFIVLFVIPYFANIVMPWERAHAIEIALKWGGLANLPASADKISVGTTGNMFTRGYTVEFVCSPKDRDEWIENSYGLKGAENTINTTGISEYQVQGQNGSNGGKVLIDKTSGKIIIDMRWG